MVDPTSDLETDVTEESAPWCATCGDPIANESTHRVVTWIDEGTVETRHFCNEDCRENWNDER
ncbi:hypothetical protein BRD01_08115 [Halobacteriales archaeon QS_8_65_32]|jgi:hypothetical protein|nr:MAG: hypothetical protein BRD01_08115 [Halobacteriales archaeon QS_8_65_32]